MKTLFATFLALAFSSVCFAGESAGKVAEAKGEVRIAGFSKILAAGDSVSVGDKIQTGHGAMARIVLMDVAAIELGADSEVVIEKAPSDKSRWSLKLLAGSLLSAVRKAAGKAVKYEVRAADTVMGVRGTVFFAQLPKESPLALCVCQGTVAVQAKSQKKPHAYTSKHHDHQLALYKGLVSKINLADTHNDDQAAALVGLLK